MGVSPYGTALMLWEELTKRRPPKEQNFAMLRGNLLENKARASFELTHNIEMKPMLAEYEPWPIARASLDGFNKDLNTGLEIKTCSKKNFEKVKNGEVPIEFWPQLQQQLLVTGASKIYLYAFNGEEGVTLEVFPDVEYCKKLLEELKKFWNCVQTDTPPEADPQRDYEVIQDEALESYVTQWKMLKVEYESVKQEIETIEEKIRSGLQITRGLCNGVRLSKSQRKGLIQYKNIEVLKGIDLEQYRSKPSEVFSIKLIK
jgi:putative phage-type endonuclease